MHRTSNLVERAKVPEQANEVSEPLTFTCSCCGVEFERDRVTSRRPCCSAVCRNALNRAGLLDQRNDMTRPALYRTPYTRWLRSEIARRRAEGIRDNAGVEWDAEVEFHIAQERR